MKKSANFLSMRCQSHINRVDDVISELTNNEFQLSKKKIMIYEDKYSSSVNAPGESWK